MDELELLKRDWQTKKDNLPKLSYNDIYQMIWKKSSSIVKWIFYISIIEFTIPHLLYIFPSVRESFSMYKDTDMEHFVIVTSIIQYAVIFYFIYLFYKRYKEINVLDNSKTLMKHIIKTRKTVKHYVIFSLFMILFMFAAIIISIYLNDDFVETYGALTKLREKMSFEKVRTISMWFFAITGIIMTLVFGGIYFLLYGILLKRLKKNYSELQKLEV